MRIANLLAAALVAATVFVAPAAAAAKPATIGTGIVVIDTALGYEQASAAGTGIVLSSTGEILTNNHVINGATTIEAVVPGTKHHYAAKVVGYDRSADIAVIQLTGASHLKTLPIGFSSFVKVGEKVTAVGNAEGGGKLVTVPGKITGIKKKIVAGDETGNTEQLVGLIETNAPIEPGDSGGPLLSATGRVIGVDAAGSKSSSAATAATDAYAIPIASAVRIAHQILAGKPSALVHIGATAFLGVAVTTPKTGTGAEIASVVTSGPAATAGLGPGDVITGFDGQTVTSPSAVGAIILGLAPGAQVTVAYTDANGAPQIATVTLGIGPPQ